MVQAKLHDCSKLFRKLASELKKEIQYNTIQLAFSDTPKQN